MLMAKVYAHRYSYNIQFQKVLIGTAEPKKQNKRGHVPDTYYNSYSITDEAYVCLHHQIDILEPTWIRDWRHPVHVKLSERVDDDDGVSRGREVHVADRHRRACHLC